MMMKTKTKKKLGKKKKLTKQWEEQSMKELRTRNQSTYRNPEYWASHPHREP